MKPFPCDCGPVGILRGGRACSLGNSTSLRSAMRRVEQTEYVTSRLHSRSTISANLLHQFHPSCRFLSLFFVPAKAREYFFTGVDLCVCVCVCVCVCDHDNYKTCGRICTYGEREDQVRVSLGLVERCGSNGQETL